MAKTIKFNLILDGYPVRNIEDLQEHFSIEDMLKYYENGLLLRWLQVREYKQQYEAVKAISVTKKQEVIEELIKIFEMEIDSDKLKKAIKILEYIDEENRRNDVYMKNAISKSQIIDDYHNGYNELLNHMEENRESMAILKADVIKMEREYLKLFVLDNFKVFFRFKMSAPKAIFAILTRELLREYWIGKSKNEVIYSSIKSEILPNVDEYLRSDIKVVCKNTEAMWDQIERPEVKVMVISIVKGTFVKNAGSFSEKLSAEDINEKFIILNGLEYQCNNDWYTLKYLEVE